MLTKNSFPSGFYNSFSIHPTAIRVFRVVLGSIVILDLILRFSNFHYFYSATGLFPHEALHDTNLPYWLSIYYYAKSDFSQFALVAFNLVVAFLFVIGKFPKISALLLFYLKYSLQTRNPAINSTAHWILYYTLLWSIFIPEEPLKKGNRKPFFAWSTLPLLIQPAIIHFHAGYSKVDGDSWIDGTALTRILLSPSTSGLLNNPTMKTLKYFEPYLSILIPYLMMGFALLLLVPGKKGRIRLTACVFFFVFHFLIAISILVGLFGPITSTTLIPLIPPSVWDWGDKKRELFLVKSKTFTSKFRTTLALSLLCLVIWGAYYSSTAHNWKTMGSAPKILGKINRNFKFIQSFAMFRRPKIIGYYKHRLELLDKNGAILESFYPGQVALSPDIYISKNIYWFVYFLSFRREQEKPDTSRAPIQHYFTSYLCQGPKNVSSLPGAPKKIPSFVGFRLNFLLKYYEPTAPGEIKLDEEWTKLVLLEKKCEG